VKEVEAPLRRLRILSLAVLVLIGLFAWALPPWLPDPHAQDLADILHPPSPGHWLGTDALGRSVVSRLSEAARVSLGLAAISAGLALAIGALLGVAAASRGGGLDRVLVSMADAAMALPTLLWVLLLAGVAPGEKWPLYVGVACAGWVEFFRTMRAAVGAQLAGPQVQSSRMLGFSRWYVFRAHLWPVVGDTLATLAAYSACNAVLAVASLGFVGIGLRPPTAELGLMMTEAFPHFDQAPWLLASPLLLLAITLLALQGLSQGAGQRRTAQ